MRKILVTILLVNIAIIFGGALKNSNYKEDFVVEAEVCPGGSVQACTDSCISGACAASDYYADCVAGCPGACNNICNEGGAGDHCGDGTCNVPGESSTNCQEDCGSGSSGSGSDDDGSTTVSDCHTNNSCKSQGQSCVQGGDIECSSGHCCAGGIGQTGECSGGSSSSPDCENNDNVVGQEPDDDVPQTIGEQQTNALTLQTTFIGPITITDSNCSSLCNNSTFINNINNACAGSTTSINSSATGNGHASCNMNVRIGENSKNSFVFLDCDAPNYSTVDYSGMCPSDSDEEDAVVNVALTVINCDAGQVLALDGDNEGECVDVGSNCGGGDAEYNGSGVCLLIGCTSGTVRAQNGPNNGQCINPGASCGINKTYDSSGNCNDIPCPSGSNMVRAGGSDNQCVCPVGWTDNNGTCIQQASARTCNTNEETAINTGSNRCFSFSDPNINFSGGSACIIDNSNTYYYCCSNNQITLTEDDDGNELLHCNANQSSLLNSIKGLNIIKKVHAQSTPDTIDPDQLDSGEYAIDPIGYESAEFEIYEDETRVRYFNDENGNGVRNAGEPFLDTDVVTINVTKTKEVRKYNLKVGWNLIGFSFVNEDLSKASELVGTLASQGIITVQVAKFDSGNWIHFVARVKANGEVQTYGTDFNFVPGEGYFIRVRNGGEGILRGNLFTESVPMTLKRGWNLRSIQSVTKYTATTFLQNCNSNNIACKTISKYVNGLYESVIKDGEKYFGENFPIRKSEGYFILNQGARGQFTP